MSKNLLGKESSPYLLQHADNPVHWRPWGPAALAEAQRHEKPILLSVGYAACHWCHVMAHESFEDDSSAAVMNELFVNIKVDREERPDIDQIYQSALGLLGEQGGWPLTMFLTPSGEPFWGGTYFPKANGYGRPAFTHVLKEVHRIFNEEPDKVIQNRNGLVDALKDLSRTDGEGVLSLDILKGSADRLARYVDLARGGIQGAPKFPQVTFFDFLWRTGLRINDKKLQITVSTTLERICQGGIYDHVGGGFSRYSVDADWLVPHFEKMLYDNAQLIRLLTRVWARTGESLFERRVRETIDWIAREMRAPDGGFAASLDADSEGVEGKFYVWSETEIDEVLGSESELFKRIYDITRTGNFEGRNIPNLLNLESPLTEADEEAFGPAKAALLEARAKRVRPGWDDKVLTDWNGMMIAALADASIIFEEPEWLAAAAETFTFIVGKLGEDGRLMHSCRGGKAQHTGMLDDYAHMCDGALALYQATGDATYLDWVKVWLKTLDAYYWDKMSGGYYFTAKDAEALIVRTRNCTDNAVPAGNAVVASVLARMELLTGKKDYRDRALETVGAFAAGAQKNIFPLTSLFIAYEQIERPALLTLVGTEAERLALLPGALRAGPPSATVLHVDDAEAIPEGSYVAKSITNTGAYVCIGPVCSLPLSTADEIALEFTEKWPTEWESAS